jgi:hypothetical protein
MDDTGEILSRLDRIGALAEAGAGRPELLREVRGLLEEGERALRAPARGPGREAPSFIPKLRRSADGGMPASRGERGGEAAMS